MTKYYKVIKDHPFWEIGAIIGSDKRIEGQLNTYTAIEDVWDKFEFKDVENDDYSEWSKVIENAPEFFQRVYRNKVEEMIFYTKDELKKLYEAKFPKKEKV